MDYVVDIWEAILRGDERAINIALGAALIFTLWRLSLYIARRVGSRITAVEESNAEIKRELASFKTEVANKYVSLDSFNSRLDGIKEGIADLTKTVADLTKAVAELQNNVAQIMGHLGLTSAKPSNPMMRKVDTKKKPAPKAKK